MTRHLAYGLLILLMVTSFLAASVNAAAQQPNGYWWPESLGDKQWKPLLGFDSRRSFFDDRSVKFLGIRIGAEYEGVHRFGLGFYSMTESIPFEDMSFAVEDAAPNPELTSDAGFGTIFLERVMYKEGKFEASLPFNLGGGNVSYYYKDNIGRTRLYRKDKFSILGAGAMVKYRVLPWLEPGLGAGLHIVWDADAEVAGALRKPYYTIRVSVLLGEVWKEVKGALN